MSYLEESLSDGERVVAVFRQHWITRIWIALWIVLFLTGLVLWVPHWIPWPFLRLVAIFVHAVAALLTIALFMIHVYMGTAVEPGAFGSMLRGDVSRKWAARYHGAWYERIAGKEEAEDRLSGSKATR